MDTTQATVLIAAAGHDQSGHLAQLLQGRCRIVLADTGRSALRLLAQSPPDLVLLDDALPDMDAHALCRHLKADPDSAHIPVLMLTGRDDAEQEQRAFDDGAADVIGKPVSRGALLARVELHLAARRPEPDAGAALQAPADDGAAARRIDELERLQAALILAMGSLAETRDNLTINHLRRTQHYVAALARELQPHPRFAAELSETNIGLMFQAAPLHDVGKVGVPDAILLKPGQLSEAEYAVMKKHTVYGRDAIVHVGQQLDSDSALLRYARQIAYSHQEKFDGSGYPEGLAGEAIPMAARLMAVADVYDALISKRIYKPAFTHETALELIRHERGEHFDPDIVDAMLAIEEQIMRIAEQYPDAA